MTSRPPVRGGRYVGLPYRWFDVVTIAYMAATGMLLLLLGYGRPGTALGVFFHAAYVVFGLEIVREGKPQSVSVELGEVPEDPNA